MIWFNIPGFFDSDGGGSRWGDAQIVMDGKETLLIDGYCEVGADRLISRLKRWGIDKPYLFLSHAHYDHYNGLRRIIADKWFKPKALYCYDPACLTAHTSDIRDNIRVLKNIISEAKARKIPVIYLTDGEHVEIGEIKFDVFRNTPKFTGNSDAYMNDGSLACWFPELNYLTTGDAGLDCANREGLHPVMIKIGHHGNDVSGYNKKPSDMALWLRQNGCKYCWDNDYSTTLTDFLQTGREDCLTQKMKYFGVHGDLNFVAYGRKVVIYKGGKNYQYPCAYNGKSALRLADLSVVESVLQGKMGSSENRVTALIRAGYYPSNTQRHVNIIMEAINA